MVKNRALSSIPQVDAEEKRSSRERGNRDLHARLLKSTTIPVFFPLKDTFRSDVRERTRVEERKKGERTGLSRKSESKSAARSCVRNARRLADYKTRKRGYFRSRWSFKMEIASIPNVTMVETKERIKKR